MKLDLVEDQRKLRHYIEQRIEEYPVYENDGPGEDDAPIQLITMGYYLEQTGYFALVFDTRIDADNDGEWTLHLDDNTTMLYFPQWRSLILAWYDGKPSDLILPNGKHCRVDQENHTHASIAQILGEMLRDTMISLRDEGALASLPLAKSAFLIVQEFDWHWCWPEKEEERKSVRLAT